MKIFILMLALLLSSPAVAATAAGKQDAGEEKTVEKAPREQDAKKDREQTPAPDANQEAAQKEKRAEPGEYVSEEYTVTMPDDWRAVMAPVVEQDILKAIFQKKTGAPVVAITIGPSGGADSKTIAEMFAEQFKAPKPPVAKDGLYTFTFIQQDVPAQVWIGTEDGKFIMTSITGAQKDALEFIRKNIKSEKYGKMLPGK